MSFTIAFWNVNMGLNSTAHRKTTFQDWCIAIQPNLLLLEEVSDTLRPYLEDMTGMTALSFVNTLDKNFKESTKQIWALQSRNYGFVSKVLSFPGLGSTRGLLKLTNPAVKDFALWVIHANASPKGGKAAVDAVNAYLKKKHNGSTLVGGDFNCAFSKAGTRARAPRSWQNNKLRMSQWRKEGGITNAPNDQLHLVTPSKSGPLLQTAIKPSLHRVIDYVMLGDDLQATTAVVNCPSEKMWRDILIGFDHCPVVYKLP
jgi:endonuclease/exonuclease/phosphatase family metal-dependent hydrolase